MNGRPRRSNLLAVERTNKLTQTGSCSLNGCGQQITENGVVRVSARRVPFAREDSQIAIIRVTPSRDGRTGGGGQTGGRRPSSGCRHGVVAICMTPQYIIHAVPGIRPSGTWHRNWLWSRRRDRGAQRITHRATVMSIYTLNVYATLIVAKSIKAEVLVRLRSLQPISVTEKWLYSSVVYKNIRLR